MGKLSAAQISALAVLARADGWQSSYKLRLGLSTLEALRSRGLVNKKAGLGSMAFPHTAIEWKITEAGRSAT